jgi:hypothetical protein
VGARDEAAADFKELLTKTCEASEPTDRRLDMARKLMLLVDGMVGAILLVGLLVILLLPA